MTHAHDHAPPADLGPAFRWAVGLNTAYVIVEAIAGFLTGSLALLADAAHNLTDVAGLLIAWGAAVLAKRAATRAHSWGLGRATIMAAMLNALAILIGVGLGDLGGVAAVPVAGRGAGADHPDRGAGGDRREHRLGAPVHARAEGRPERQGGLSAHGGRCGGFGRGGAGGGGHHADRLDMARPGRRHRGQPADRRDGGGPVPRGAAPQPRWRPRPGGPGRGGRWLARQESVRDVHDLHIWPLSTTRTALAVHVVSEAQDTDAVLHDLAEGLEHGFGIAHSTIRSSASPAAPAAFGPTRNAGHPFRARLQVRPEESFTKLGLWLF